MVDTRTTQRSKAVAPPPIKSKEDEKESARELRARRREMSLAADSAKLYSKENLAKASKSHVLVEGVIDPDGPQFMAIRGESESPEIIFIAPLTPKSRAKAAASKIADSAKVSTLKPSNVLWKPTLPAGAYYPTRHPGPTPGAPRTAASGFISRKAVKASQVGLASTGERRGATSTTSASSLIPQSYATTSAPVTRRISLTLADRTKAKAVKEPKDKTPK
ncbi:uncharacterized protein L3040_007799 [Drepanopeziza brunnea f. sp. 'multigermtubi']|uniref:Uncharacterized protein n=1 Tax=Marssonina brunnea f. sp. multigermtubi (strain MB_m1) TaxID=1072389 RepID=K1WSS9_MARBU|nr:uncharacterized protein MBM_05405 [Drepanopeziza brunnea f. sp. 'multigermtubi' MB_m1]EKD16111.1 hypothetical protein MBM_05405 [Drepanopeziza brunnea f. sp. 'multigermtubi' MB_m1]KAJ5035324.1 hypothetical protein L3040_007799 [Drepanopeziza brunnea f. sp. 'multigermtubi']